MSGMLLNEFKKHVSNALEDFSPRPASLLTNPKGVEEIQWDGSAKHGRNKISLELRDVGSWQPYVNAISSCKYQTGALLLTNKNPNQGEKN